MTRNLNFENKQTEIDKYKQDSLSPHMTFKPDFESYQNKLNASENTLKLPKKTDHIKSGIIMQTVTFKEPNEFEKPSLASKGLSLRI